jgi:hypothetical protein
MPAQSHGFDNTVVVGKETTYGTAPTGTAFKWVGIVESFEPEESNNIDSRMSVGVRAPLMLRQGAKEVDGSLSVALQNARLIALALGRHTTTGDATAGFTHTIRPVRAGEELPSFTVQNNNPLIGLTRNYVGGKVDSLTITASAEEAVTMESEILFSHVEDSGITPAVVTAELDNYFMFYEGSVKVNNVAVADITEFELEIANNLERRFTLNGQNRPARIEEGNLEITASITMDFTSKTHWNSFKNGENVTFELMLQDSTASKHSVKITLTGGLYDTNSIAVGAEDLQEQELEAVFTGIEVVAVDANSTLV